MKLFFVTLAAFLFSQTPSLAAEPLALQSPLTLNLNQMLKLVRENLNGWTRLSLDGDRSLWTPHSFYSQKISDPKQWISQVRQLDFCQPDKTWKEFPVLSVSNDQIAESFEQVAANPHLGLTTQMMYSETVVVGGKARNISYNYNQAGPMVKITCSAANELGDVQTISQDFDVRNPKKFQVEQKKNGKLLQI